MNYYKSFKKIRKAKGITQKKISEDLITQSTLSKYENGENKFSIEFDKMVTMINRMGLSVDEFIFYNNNYQFTLKEKLLNEFYSISFNSITELKEMRKKCLTYQKEHFDEDIQELSEICLFLILNENEPIMNKFKEFIQPIWTRVSKTDEFFIQDIQIINNLLFIFPIDSTIEITKTLLRKCEKYNNFKNVKNIKIKIKINLTSLLIQNKCYKIALENLLELKKTHRFEMSIYMYLVVLTRIYICDYQLGNKDNSKKCIINIFKLVKIYEIEDFFKKLYSEIELCIQDIDELNSIRSIIKEIE